MPRFGGSKGKGKDKGKERSNRPLFRRRKFCRFTAEGIKEVDYKNIEILKDFINENGRIIRPASPAPRRVSSASCRSPSSARASWH